MNLSEPFIRRPIMTTLVMAAILIFGFMSYRLLPISDLPSVDYPTIQVSAARPGASPETMAASVARPLEKQFSSIAGLDSLNSTSTLGQTQITLQFNLSRNIDDAAQDVQAAISGASGQIADDLPNPPTYSKVNPADQPILYLYLDSPTLPLSQVDNYAETYLAQKLSTINGVAQVAVYGSQKYAARIQLDPQQLATRQIGLDQVATAIQQGNVNLPTGSLSGNHKNFTVQTNGQLEDAAAYRQLIVSYKDGMPIYLNQLGRIIDSVENDKVASWYNNTRAIILTIQRQPGTNTVQVVDTIKKLLPNLQDQIPASVEIGILYDASQSIRDSVDDVRFTLILTIALVILVIFLFLRNLSATVIPSLALPVSLIGTFAVMYLLHYSLDNLSLMALTLSVGFVVDDAIVMLENIVRHMEMGERPLEAALNGSREIGFTILSMTLSLVAVFIPMLFMSEVLGRLFHEFAVTIAVAILVSGFVSLSLTPMLCSRFLRPVDHANQSRLYQASEYVFDRFLGMYDWSLKKVLKYHRTTMILSVVLFAVTVGLLVVVPKGFIPSEDTGQITGITQAAEDASFDNLVQHQQTVANLIRQDPNVDAVNSNIGAGASASGSGAAVAANSGSLFIRLKPRSQRQLSADEIVQNLRTKLATVPGIQVFLQNPPAIPIGAQQSTGLYQVALQSSDVKPLQEYVPQLVLKMKEMTELQDVNSDLQFASQIQIDIDRDKASTYGITAEQIENTLRNAYGSYQVSTIYAATNEYQVILELAPQFQQDINALLTLYINSSTGVAVPLNTFAKLSQGVSPLMVNHNGRMNAATISFNLAPGVSLGNANQEIEELIDRVIPASISTSFQGASQVFQSSLPSLGLLLAIAILVIYLILGILYEDFIHPITILSGLPSAGFGALLTLIIFHVELNVYSFIGIILLVGIVKKNGIMMVDFAIEAQRNELKKPSEAIYQACLVRFRPIMMTTMAALMGTLPIAIGFGAGSESRRPLGIAVVGGLVFSQILTLYLTPVFYIYMESWRKKLSQVKFRRVFSFTGGRS
ncbi:efflux RND transporter permease subunit [Nostoc sp. 'Lobaria pulmonaria (5183) cyanobiont']|uniref:efflux RND transporter permease subunit n=1 Tax=Nostoc sp. 'Lobaria pulmonaria (5183) cyanobiont' TaxID=1618022 RepID=UPI000CF31A0B|nr:efflux RND transporter permease subunit [Nostoc sp. 'Lobaria pulmonaria (5183) cyanobiont']AVH69778.1 acriflavin resistance protein [Nostoc sp. 'Lobaria pulmonaria (5183) cyanobiont']